MEVHAKDGLASNSRIKEESNGVGLAKKKKIMKNSMRKERWICILKGERVVSTLVCFLVLWAVCPGYRFGNFSPVVDVGIFLRF